MTNGHDEPALSEREQEIIAVGASIASGCLPCTKYHLRAAASAGASAREVLDVVRNATQVRRAATEISAWTRVQIGALHERRWTRPLAIASSSWISPIWLSRDSVWPV